MHWLCWLAAQVLVIVGFLAMVAGRPCKRCSNACFTSGVSLVLNNV